MAGKKSSSAVVGWLLKEAPKGALMENEAAKLVNDLGFKLVVGCIFANKQ